MPHQKINLVSPPFSCGVAWLVNVLMEMDIKCSNMSFPQNWVEEHDGSETLESIVSEHLSWHLPILHKKNNFQFPELLTVQWEHRLDLCAQSMNPTILFVRDPRDAIYSFYKRHYSETLTLDEYLSRPDIWPTHFPGMMSLPPPETYSLFINYWLARYRRSKKLILVRFEDCKVNPIDTIIKILKFLNITRSQQDISMAIENSSFEKAKKAMELKEKSTGNKFLVARKGQPFEWKENYSKKELSHFHTPLNANLLDKLGYDSVSPVAMKPPLIIQANIFIKASLFCLLGTRKFVSFHQSDNSLLGKASKLAAVWVCLINNKNNNNTSTTNWRLFGFWLRMFLIYKNDPSITWALDNGFSIAIEHTNLAL